MIKAGLLLGLLRCSAGRLLVLQRVSSGRSIVIVSVVIFAGHGVSLLLFIYDAIVVCKYVQTVAIVETMFEQYLKYMRRYKIEINVNDPQPSSRPQAAGSLEKELSALKR
jgi:hypothetical protein